jgi:hypothetical protein
VTDEQHKAIEAYQRLGSIRAAARELDMPYTSAHRAITRWQTLMLRAAEVPAGYKLHNISTTVDKNGEVVRTTEHVGEETGGGEPVVIDAPIREMVTAVRGDGTVERQWIRQTVKDQKTAETWRAYAEELLKPVLPGNGKFLETQVLDPLVAAKDQCVVYPIGDYHVGMLAWGAETRSDNHDLPVAESLLQEAAETLMDATSPCETCVLAFMGDFIHFDSYKPVTAKSNNQLDADSRFGKVGRTAMRVIRHVIAAARRRHRHVHVIWLRGNHDESVAELIKVFLGMFYEGEPGITVDTSPSYFSYYEFGRNLMGFAHGDKLKPSRMPMVMANDMAEAWGRCPERIIFTGHVHQESRSDEYGVILEQVPVIIPPDAYAAENYRSRRAMQAIVFDREYGEIERRTYNPRRFYLGR